MLKGSAEDLGVCRHQNVASNPQEKPGDGKPRRSEPVYTFEYVEVLRKPPGVEDLPPTIEESGDHKLEILNGGEPQDEETLSSYLESSAVLFPPAVIRPLPDYRPLIHEHCESPSLSSGPAADSSSADDEQPSDEFFVGARRCCEAARAVKKPNDFRLFYRVPDATTAVPYRLPLTMVHVDGREKVRHLPVERTDAGENPLEGDLAADHLILMPTTRRPPASRKVEAKRKGCSSNKSCESWMANGGCTKKIRSSETPSSCPPSCRPLLCSPQLNRKLKLQRMKRTKKNVRKQQKK
ncbi:hypothetical protein M3Y99_01704000 [Aphelenchoides fujianensis]|nr:hypothetical protein M3Y99_01704000 [Aphelenchoides fujianensis]